MVEDKNKRKTLKQLAKAGLYVSGGLLGASLAARTSFASCSKSWGELPSGSGLAKNYKILEIFLDRGASQWETFWLPGTRQQPNYLDFGLRDLNQAYGELKWLNRPEYPCKHKNPLPLRPQDSTFFARASDNKTFVHWGAPAKPIFTRPDIFDRCRMVTQFHDIEPHEAAIPYALSGFRLGDPRRIGTGAAVQKRYCAESSTPKSFILHSISRYTADMASANGLHESIHKPIVVRLASNNEFANNLGRSEIGKESDDLLEEFQVEFKDQLKLGNEYVRSSGFESYSAAMGQLVRAKTLQQLFQNDILVITRNNEVCAELGNVVINNRLSVKASLNAAAELLGKGARYACVIDPGRAGSYDSHSGENTKFNSHLLRTSASLYHVMFELANLVKSSSNPKGKIDLDKTMIVLNTEFGRTPGINAAFGRDHWPWGYTTLLIGGPIVKGKRGIAGSINPAGYTDINFRYTPTDVRAAILLAAGVDPLAPNLFDRRDFSTVIGKKPKEKAIRAELKKQILGL